MDERGLRRVFTKLDIDTADEVDGWLMASCPFAEWTHSTGRDSSPSFGVSIHDDDRSHYHCFTCKRKGDLAGLAFQLARYRDEPELLAYGKKLAVDELLGGSDDFGAWDEKSDKKKEKDFRVREFPDEGRFYQYPSVISVPRALRYLRRRGIHYSTALKIGLRFDAKQHRILFPVYDHFTHAYAGCSGRSILSKREVAELEQLTGRVHPKIRDYGGLEKRKLLLGRTSQRTLLFARREKRTRTHVLIVEGLFAYARFTQLGFADNTRAILGSELTEEKAEILKDIGLAVYWFTDNDLAGRECLYGSYEKKTKKHKGGGAIDLMYGHVAQFIPTWPEGKTDPDELTRDEVEHMIQTAEFYTKPVDNHRSRRYGDNVITSAQSR